MVIRPERADPKSSFERVKRLRNFNDLAYHAKACCASNLELVQRLIEGPVPAFKDSNDLDLQRLGLRGYVESCDVLIPRIRNTIDLVG
jgi:hypothetical protein